MGSPERGGVYTIWRSINAQFILRCAAGAGGGLGRAPRVLGCLWLVVAAGCAKVDDPSIDPAARTLPPTPPPLSARTPDPLRQVFFGDLHIHTGLSTDAYILGVRATPDDAYRFARGEAIQHAAGFPIRIRRPLDFAAVTDHSEYLGQAREAGLDIPTNRRSVGRILREEGPAGITRLWFASAGEIRDHGFSPGGEPVKPEVNRAAWQQVIAAAEAHNTPGLFTAFIGYEWSANAGDITAHLHRNVIYRSGEVSALPFSSLDSSRPEDLWQFLSRETAAGREAMAIPHNGNFSRGFMYAETDSDGKPLTADYAALRSRYEPISEIFQIKGASETHPTLSPQDEFAGFEQLGESLLTESELPTSIAGSYLRDALGAGLAFADGEGFNPFRYGVIGSSDSHNASSPTDEDDYTGKLPMLDGSAGLRTGKALLLPASVNPATRWGSGGLAGVWAEENSRESLFGALRRRETFATSGPRISVRLFAGWDYREDLLTDPDIIARAYAGGVPMGGDLAPGKGAPMLLVMANRDPAGAKLDRAQVIKLWVDEAGQRHEKIYDVAAADGRRPRADGTLPPVGNTVSLNPPGYDNSIGGDSILTLWQDPAFDPAEPALYYLRVLEIPTPRWSTYDAAALGSEPLEPTSIQERAVSSAIWYLPPR